jgi:hypothetical protein
VPLRNIPTAMEVAVRAETTAGQHIMWKFGAIKVAGGIAHSDCLAVANIVAGWIGTDQAALCNTSVYFDDVVVASRETANPYVAELPVNTPGTRHGDPLPSSVTCAISKVTGLLGRSNHGHNQAFPTVVTDLQTADTWKPAYIASLGASWVNLLGFLDTGGYPMGIISNVFGHIIPVLSIAILDLNVDRQGTRLIGRGA